MRIRMAGSKRKICGVISTLALGLTVLFLTGLGALAAEDSAAKRADNPAAGTAKNSAVGSVKKQAQPAQRLAVLFLGDAGHHQPQRRAAPFASIMAGRGIDVAYSENLQDLNPANLAKYQALVLYANLEKIEPREEAALLEYVRGGGGFVPLHCASFCFQNSPDYIALVGAQFEKHGTGEFETKTVVGDHPITRDLPPFKTWDETYTHRKHNPAGRTVLQTRGEGDKAEPWTWVRSEGRGRVFYTAYGHDARTWSNPGFLALVERGIRWAANRGEVFDTRAARPTDAKPFEYAVANLPNYVPSAKWGAMGEAINKMQLPLSPAESMKHAELPPGFRLELFASEPQIGKPIAMAWDHRGRLWLAETVDYPNDQQPTGQGNDRIRICEDTDGDGRADKFTLFADKLSIPTSLLLFRDGVIVVQAPDTLFLRDTNGDDKADKREVLFTGWGTNDTHAGPSNLRYGFDNWIWGMCGYAGFEGTVGGEKHSFRQGFFRFKPDGSKLEFLRSTSNNSWGVGFSEEGLAFGSTANGTPSVFLSMPNRYYESVRGWSATTLPRIALDNRMYPVTDKVRQVDHHGGFTAAAGHALYTARNYPPLYWNRAAFVTEPTGHLAATFLLEKQGSDFISYNAWNLLASRDEWTSPIAAEVGPDGNVWIIDWYNYIVQHNPTPQGFKNGRGNAYETKHRDKTHGRIYRVIYRDEKGDHNSAGPTKLDPKDAKGLVDALKSDNQFWRLTAQRLLVDDDKLLFFDAEAQDRLLALAVDRSIDEAGLNTSAIHALAVLASRPQIALGVVTPLRTEVFQKVMRHPSAGVRRAAVLAFGDYPTLEDDFIRTGIVNDNDPQVRLAALLALSTTPKNNDLVAATILEALDDPNNLKDAFIPHAATVAAAAHAEGFLLTVAARKTAPPANPTWLEAIGRVAEHFARGDSSASLPGLINALGKAEPRVAETIIAGLDRGWPKASQAKLNTETERKLVALIARVSPAAQVQLISLSKRWGSQGLEKYAAEISKSLEKTLVDAALADAVRIDAARQLVGMQRGSADAAKSVLEQLSARSSQELSLGLVEAVGRSQSAETGKLLIGAIDKTTPTVQAAIVSSLLASKDWSGDLVTALDENKISAKYLSLDQQQALAAHPDKDLAARAKKVFSRGAGLPSPDRQKVIEELSPLVLKGGDVARGKIVFKAQCAKCHAHSGEGNRIGPDLTGMAVHPRHELLTAILDPSRSVEGNFVQYTVSTDEGRVYNGLLMSESKTAIELADAEGKTHALQRENIETLTASKKSLMPEGFEKQVPTESLADLLAFLTQRGKFLPLDLRKVATVVSTRGMFHSEEAEPERMIFSDWSPKTFAGVPFQLVDPQQGKTRNAILLHGPQGKLPPQMPRSVSLAWNAPAKAIHLLSGVSGWGFAGGTVNPTVSMIVRLHYEGGRQEDHELKNGVHFADYIRRVDVPESKFAFALRNQQLRYLAIQPKRADVIEKIELVKGPDRTAPIVMAITVESRE